MAQGPIDIEFLTRFLGISRERYKRLKEEFKEEDPDEDMTFELHLLRGLEDLESKELGKEA